VLVLYQNGLRGFPKGRLIGASSYEGATDESPYRVDYPNIPYLHPFQFRLGSAKGYYNHAYAVIEFVRADPDEPIRISYYQYPSWVDYDPHPPEWDIGHSCPRSVLKMDWLEGLYF
jgi:hypothetical protein